MNEEWLTFHFYCDGQWLGETDELNTEKATQDAIDSFLEYELPAGVYGRTIEVRLDSYVVATILLPAPIVTVKHKNLKELQFEFDLF